MISAGLIAVALMQAPMPPSRPVALLPDPPRVHGHTAVNPRHRPTPWPGPLAVPPGPQAAQPAPLAPQPAAVAATPETAPSAAGPQATPGAERPGAAPGAEAPLTAPGAAAVPTGPVAVVPPTAPDAGPPPTPFPASPSLAKVAPPQDRDAPALAEASPRAPDAAPIPLTRAAQTLALAADPGQAAPAPGAGTGGDAPQASAPDTAPKPRGRPRAPRPDLTLAALTPTRPQPTDAALPDRPQPSAPARPERPEPAAPAPRQIEIEDGTQLALNAAPPDRYVCRDPRLVGSAIPDIGAPGTGCGVENPVRITAIGSILLTTPAVMTCPTARAVANWVTGVANPRARQTLGAPIAKIWVMGSYVCRNRNGLAGGRLSEHARGMALDIGGVTLTNGRSTTVLEGWGKGREGAFWRDVRRAACGGFQTVLGPGSDRFHANHLHLDTSLRGGTPYCR